MSSGATLEFVANGVTVFRENDGDEGERVVHASEQAFHEYRRAHGFYSTDEEQGK